MRCLTNLKKSFVMGMVIIMVFVTGLTGCKYQEEVKETEEEVSLSAQTRYVDTIFDKVDSETDIVYGESVNYLGKDEKLLLDIYTPSGDDQISRPAIIWLHGGGFTSGTKTNNFERDLALEFAKKGYVTLSINYRLRPQESAVDFSAIKDVMEDIATAVNWLTVNADKYGVDATKISFGGYSAGAAAVINFCYSDLSVYNIDKNVVMCVIDLAGGQVYSGIEKSDPPCIIIHGTADAKVPFNQSNQLASQLKQNGVYNTMYSIEGADHDLKTYYDDIVGQITKFLYKKLTGINISTPEKPSKPHEYQKVEERIATKQTYDVKQINLTMDGQLDEWKNCEVMYLNQLKDAGTALPNTSDFSGTAMVAWNQQDKGRIYIAATITDDVIQDINSSEGKWFNDDCLEIAFDLSQNNSLAPVSKFVVGATGKDLSVLASKENTQLKVTKKDYTYTFEIAIDLSKINIYQENSDFHIGENGIIGFSIAYNDGEGNVREHQIGWTLGEANNRLNFGNLQFVREFVK